MKQQIARNKQIEYFYGAMTTLNVQLIHLEEIQQCTNIDPDIQPHVDAMVKAIRDALNEQSCN